MTKLGWTPHEWIQQRRDEPGEQVHVRYMIFDLDVFFSFCAHEKHLRKQEDET